MYAKIQLQLIGRQKTTFYQNGIGHFLGAVISQWVDNLVAVQLSLHMRSCGNTEFQKFFSGFSCLQSNECTLEKNVPRG